MAGVNASVNPSSETHWLILARKLTLESSSIKLGKVSLPCRAVVRKKYRIGFMGVKAM